MTELVRTHLLDMEAQAGGPQQYPDWALRQFVKSTILADVVPPQVLASVATAYDDPSPEKARYEQQLDRALGDEGLTYAEEVFAAVTISSDDWDQMTEEERRKVLERDADDVVP